MNATDNTSTPTTAGSTKPSAPHIYDINERWTEVEHLPEWDEEFYHVYTAKKLGKWVMLKTLRPELKDRKEYVEMLDKEFEVRYNLAHPNIVMINDYEDIPTLGRCIITDDVYGLSLRKLIDTGRLRPHHIDKLRTSLVSAMEYIQVNHLVHHPIRPETIIFTDKIENLKLIDVGFDQKKNLSKVDTASDMYSFGKVVLEALDALEGEYDDVLLRRVANRCIHPDPQRRYRNVDALRLALSGQSNRRMYMLVAVFVCLMILLLAWLVSPWRPSMLNEESPTAPATEQVQTTPTPQPKH